MTTVVIPKRPVPMTIADLIAEAAELWHRLLTAIGVVLPGRTVEGFRLFVERIVMAAGPMPLGLSPRRHEIDQRLRDAPAFSVPLMAVLREREISGKARAKAEVADAKVQGISIKQLKGRKAGAATRENAIQRKAAKALETA